VLAGQLSVGWSNDYLDAAQALLDAQLRTDWPALLGGVAALSNPAEQEIFGDFAVPYYWSVDESEWATDFLFRSPEALAGLYPRLLRHGTFVLGSADVLRYLGKKLTPDKLLELVRKHTSVTSQLSYLVNNHRLPPWGRAWFLCPYPLGWLKQTLRCLRLCHQDQCWSGNNHL